MNLQRHSRSLAALALLVAAGATHAATWSTIGSAGTVDNEDSAQLDLAAGEARVLAAALPGTVVNLRYNVVALKGFAGTKTMNWVARLRDNGVDSQVRLTLRQYTGTGTYVTLATFDSNAFPAAVAYQTLSKCISVTWDFDNGPFYIEAELIKSQAAGLPALGQMLLTPATCTP